MVRFEPMHRSRVPTRVAQSENRDDPVASRLACDGSLPYRHLSGVNGASADSHLRTRRWERGFMLGMDSRAASIVARKRSTFRLASS